MHLSMFDFRSFRGGGFVTDHLLVDSELRGYFQQVNGLLEVWFEEIQSQEGAIGGLLSAPYWVFRFHKTQRFSGTVQKLVAAEENLCFVESVSLSFNQMPVCQLSCRPMRTRVTHFSGVSEIVYSVEISRVPWTCNRLATRNVPTQETQTQKHKPT
jgi:hypothetical protein